MPETPSRRDLNRERTRVALVEALVQILDTEGLDAVTAGRLADTAGVSRRTFFNYYAGVDALMAAGAQGVLAQVAAVLTNRPPDESLVDSVLAAVEEVVTVELLDVSARVWRAIDASPSARRFSLEAAAALSTELAHDWARDRLTHRGVAPDSLRESVVMATLQIAFDEARQQWLHAHDGPVDEAALVTFLVLVRRAYEMVRPVVDHPAD